MSFKDIIRISPRFAIMIGAMILSVCFLITDICSVTGVFDDGSLPVGINPFWKLSFVFKCLTDSVILDDFKTALDRLRAFKISRIGSFAVEGSATDRTWRNGLSEQHHPWAMEEIEPSDKKTKKDAKSIFQPHTVTKITAGSQRGESSAGLTRSETPTWTDSKASSNHIEEAVRETSRDREEQVANDAGVTRHRGLREPERSWLRDSGGDMFRPRQKQGGETLEETTYESDSIGDVDPRDVEAGKAR